MCLPLSSLVSLRHSHAWPLQWDGHCHVAHGRCIVESSRLDVTIGVVFVAVAHSCGDHDRHGCVWSEAATAWSIGERGVVAGVADDIRCIESIACLYSLCP